MNENETEIDYSYDITQYPETPLVGGSWLLPYNNNDNSYVFFKDNIIGFNNDYLALRQVASVDVAHATNADIAMMLQYTSYELFMLRVLGTIALVFSVFVVSIKALRGFRNRIKGGRL